MLSTYQLISRNLTKVVGPCTMQGNAHVLFWAPSLFPHLLCFSALTSYLERHLLYFVQFEGLVVSSEGLVGWLDEHTLSGILASDHGDILDSGELLLICELAELLLSWLCFCLCVLLGIREKCLSAWCKLVQQIYSIHGVFPVLTLLLH